MKLPTGKKLPSAFLSSCLRTLQGPPQNWPRAVQENRVTICVTFLSRKNATKRDKRSERKKRLQRLTPELRAGTCILEPNQQSWCQGTLPTGRVALFSAEFRSLKQLWKFGLQNCRTKSRIMGGCSHTSFTLVLSRKDTERTSLM